jgi:small GTP-binding protein
MTPKARKICLLGDFAVGKTSLVTQFLHHSFSERYLTTVGVKVDTRQLTTRHGEVKLVIWDLAGAARLNAAGRAYLQGSAGLLLVCDATRRETLGSVLDLHQQTRELLGSVPALLLVNKCDLEARAEIDEAALAAASSRFDRVLRTSARTGANVAEAFLDLAERCP